MWASKKRNRRATTPNGLRRTQEHFITWDRRRVDGGAVRPGTVRETQAGVHCNGCQTRRTAEDKKITSFMPPHKRSLNRVSPAVLGVLQMRFSQDHGRRRCEQGGGQESLKIIIKIPAAWHALSQVNWCSPL